MSTAQPTIPRDLAAEFDRGDPITIGALTLQRAPGAYAKEPLVRLSFKGRSQIFTLDELEQELNSAKSSSTPHVWPACPTWCVRDARLDEGTPDEILIHNGAVREAGGFTVHLQRTDDREGQGDTVEIFLDDTELSLEEAAALTAALSATTAEAQPQADARTVIRTLDLPEGQDYALFPDANVVGLSSRLDDAGRERAFMGPDDALRRLREAIDKLDSDEEFHDATEVLSRNFRVLDEWLSKGGVAPLDWWAGSVLLSDGTSAATR